MRIGEVDAMYISRKFRALYFFAALAIVLIHSGAAKDAEVYRVVVLALLYAQYGSVVRNRVWQRGAWPR